MHSDGRIENESEGRRQRLEDQECVLGVAWVIAKTMWLRRVAGSFDEIEWFISGASGNEQRGERNIGHGVQCDPEDSNSNSIDDTKKELCANPRFICFILHASLVAQMKLNLWYYLNSKFT